ncbi:hypothetical protein [Staphylococcus aureus]|uniref:hypothetical protein n=1 Tax=Staphylococcus aureus TaxID=1280 RepID=UPI003CF74AB5
MTVEQPLTMSTLDENYLYTAEPEDFGKINSPYHCRNWVFELKRIEESDTYYMQDTYWVSQPTTITVTPDNVHLFKPLFDMREVVKIPDDDEKFMYNPEDIFHVRDQNQFKHRISVYKRKEAKKNIDREIEILEYRLSLKKREEERIRSDVECLENELQQKKEEKE